MAQSEYLLIANRLLREEIEIARRAARFSHVIKRFSDAQVQPATTSSTQEQLEAEHARLLEQKRRVLASDPALAGIAERVGADAGTFVGGELVALIANLRVSIDAYNAAASDLPRETRAELPKARRKKSAKRSGKKKSSESAASGSSEEAVGEEPKLVIEGGESVSYGLVIEGGEPVSYAVQA
jgi:hypothetical protein